MAYPAKTRTLNARPMYVRESPATSGTSASRPATTAIGAYASHVGRPRVDRSPTTMLAAPWDRDDPARWRGVPRSPEGRTRIVTAAAASRMMEVT